jgi:hypothetical protein
MNRSLLLVLVLAPFVVGCFAEPDVGAPLAGLCNPEDSDPTKEVSFGLDIQPLIDRPSTEGGCSCHNAGAGAPAGFDMTSLTAMRRGGATSGAKIIIPGDPCNSVLAQKLSPAPPTGARMPLVGPPFWTNDEQQLLRDWIAEGAKPN